MLSECEYTELPRLRTELSEFVIVFTSAGCPPCRELQSILEHLARGADRPHFVLCRVPSKRPRDWDAEYLIKGFPTLVSVFGGRIREQRAGVRRGQVEDVWCELVAFSQCATRPSVGWSEAC
jgi:thioredoxin-like negative regulator of GroEL